MRGVTDGGYLTDPEPLEAELSVVRTIIGTDIDDGVLARLAGPRIDVRAA